MNYKSKSYRIFTIFNYIFLAILSITCIIPLLHILAVSFSTKSYAEADMVTFWPRGFTFEAYRETLFNKVFIHSVWISVIRTVFGPILSLFLTVTAAYSLEKEKREFKSRNIYMWFFIFVMLFNGGLVPTYMVICNLHLRDTLWVLILPNAVSVYNTILILNFFRTSVPSVLKDAAFIDGADHIRTMINVYLPLSVPALVTITLFNIVGNWNSYFDGLIYMTTTTNYPLATFLQTFVVQENLAVSGLNSDTIRNISQRTVKAAQVFLAVAPILMVYPFLQKYFITGIVIGAVKE